MRVAVISDIHANLHALDAVWQAVEADAPGEIWCLGDLVGYGPRPNECCAAVRERTDLCLVGNHDLVALGSAEVDLDEFNPDAAAAAQWTRDALSVESRAFLEGLDPSAQRPGVDLYHASPRDPVWEYVLSDVVADECLAMTSAPIVLVGHSHVPLVRSPDFDVWGIAQADAELDVSRGRWLLNPGSVGQPRDGDPRAAYLLLDLGAMRASFRRVEYLVARTQAEILDRGLPDSLALRLGSGV